MRKGILLLMLVLLSTLITSAAPVSESAARRIAASFLEGRGLAVMSPGALLRVKIAKPAKAKATPYYIYNAAGGKGFVVVSGDDRTPQILGYSDDNTIDANAIPQNIKAFLATYADEISYLDRSGVTTKWSGSAVRHSQRVMHAVSPLLTSKWGQDDPYNGKCPYYQGEQTVTGCVATATAQVMNYFKWPAQTTRGIPAYYYYSNGSENDQTINVDSVPVSTIDWDNILGEYTSSATQTQKDAVANLMLYVGCSVEMNYSLAKYGGSGAMSSMIAPALRNYFDYSAHYITRSNRTLADFESTLYDEVNDGRPIVFCGSSSGGGHCFVIDGCDGEGRFHVNWGWNGMADGFFLISVLNPGTTSGIGASSTSDGYSMYQSAVIGIERGAGKGITTDEADQATTPADGQLTTTNWQYTGNKQSGIAQPVTITVNNNGNEFYGTVLLFASTSYNVDFSSESPQSATGISAKANGNTDITMLFTPQSEGTYYLLLTDINNNIIGRSTVEITSGNSTTDQVLSLQSIDVDGNQNGTVYGSTLSGKVTVKNTSSKSYSDNVILFLLKEGNDEYYRSVDYVFTTLSVDANGTSSFNYKFDELEATGYALELTYNDGTSSSNPTEIGNATWLTLTPGVATYLSDGTATYAAPSSTYTVDPDVAAVDLSNVDSTVTKVNADGANPNTLFYFSSADAKALEGLKSAGRNVVVGDVADEITLTDGHDFICPKPFTATSITYTRQPSIGTDGNGGWETICLPFEATAIVADGKTQHWFTSKDDKGRDLWVMEFSQVDDNSNVVFNFNSGSTLAANTPYIIAVPGDKWGAEYSLVGKTLSFTATNAPVAATDKAIAYTSDYSFNGTLHGNTLENIYNLNADGTAFERTSATVPAFRAYFTKNNGNTESAKLNILVDGDDSTTGINGVSINADGLNNSNAPMYNLAGQRVDKNYKGLVILNGNKFIRK